jgi:hypothetical protein
VSSAVTAAVSRPDAAVPGRRAQRRALASTRVASAMLASARSASSPVITSTVAFARSLRSFRCAEIDRAARRQDRLPQRLLRIGGDQHQASIPLPHRCFGHDLVIRPRTSGSPPAFPQPDKEIKRDYFGTK